MCKFITRYYKREDDLSSYIFAEVIKKSQISIVLGEPASGKTYQLEYFDKNIDNAKFVELKTNSNEKLPFCRKMVKNGINIEGKQKKRYKKLILPFQNVHQTFL